MLCVSESTLECWLLLSVYKRAPNLYYVYNTNDCETTPAHQLFQMLVTQWLMLRINLLYKMYWTPTKMLLLADVDEYSFENSIIQIVNIKWASRQNTYISLYQL